MVRNTAATMSLCDFGTNASRLRAKWTRQRWCPTPWKMRASAATRPLCWSEMTSPTAAVHRTAEVTISDPPDLGITSGYADACLHEASEGCCRIRVPSNAPTVSFEAVGCDGGRIARVARLDRSTISVHSRPESATAPYSSDDRSPATPLQPPLLVSCQLRRRRRWI